MLTESVTLLIMALIQLSRLAWSSLGVSKARQKIVAGR
jgi:hypothetical protein